MCFHFVVSAITTSQLTIFYKKFVRLKRTLKDSTGILLYAMVGTEDPCNQPEIEESTATKWTQNGFPTLRFIFSKKRRVLRFTLFCRIGAVHICQGKAHAQGDGLFPCQGLQRRIGEFDGSLRARRHEILISVTETLI